MPGPCFASRRLRHGAGALRHAAGVLGSLAAARRVAYMGALVIAAWGGAWTASLVTAPARAEETSLAPAAAPDASFDAFLAVLEKEFATGETRYASARCDSAVADWERTLARRPDALCERLEALGTLLADQRQFATARPVCRRLLELRRKMSGEVAAVSPAYALLVRVERGLGDLAAARKLTEEELGILRRGAAADTAVALAFYGLGKICYDQHDYVAAEGAYRQTLARFESTSPPDHKMVVWCLNDLADTRRIAGDFVAAESLLVRAVAVSEAHLPRNSGHARLLNNLGALYWDLDRLDEAERLYRQALRISAADPAVKPRRLATAHLNLGVLTRDQGKFEEAEPLLRQALELARLSVRVPDPAGFVYFLNEPAKLYAASGNWDEAIRLWEEALGILSHLEIPHEIYHAQILNDTAEALLARGNKSRAEELFRQALEKRERILGRTHPEVGVTLVGLAQATVGKSSATPECQELLTRALAILEPSAASPEAEAEAWALEAHLERSRGDSKAAMHSLERALALVEELRPRRGGGDASRILFLQRFADYYNDMIAWLVESGQTDEALAYAERIRARVLHEQLAAGRVEPLAGVPTATRGPLEQREHEARRRITRIQQEINLARANWTATDRDGVARIAALEKELEAALRDYREVTEEIQVHSPAWRRLLQQRDAGFSVQVIQERLLRPDELLLLYQIGTASSFLFVVPPAPGEVECHALMLAPEAAKAAGVSPGSFGSETLAALVSGRNAMERPGSVVGGIVRLRKVTGAVPVAAEAKPLPAAQRLEKSHLLWKTLVPPTVWKRIVEASQVVVVPDGSLHQLPFEALVVEPAPASDPSYWLDAGPPIRYTNSITTLLDITGRESSKNASRRVLTVCDPVFDPKEVASMTEDASPTEVAARGGSTSNPSTGNLSTSSVSAPGEFLLRGAGLPRLPATARESEAIQKAFGPKRVVCLRGLQATESRVAAEIATARYVHIATHGIVDESHDDLLAALLFTPPAAGAKSAAEDGCLHLFEIYELPLDCELAVLSACETEAGRRIQGEGVFALSRGFLVAGAQRTVASLWPVADESTALLMADFFRRVAAAEAAGGAIDYTIFLRDAKRALRRQTRWSEPFFWAPFVVSGVR